jgi:hypothetical protein
MPKTIEISLKTAPADASIPVAQIPCPRNRRGCILPPPLGADG